MASNLQKVRTDKYGELEVVQSFHEGPRVIHLLKNGAYVFDSGLPVKEKSDLQKGLGRTSTFLEDAIQWLEHKDDRVDGTIREIKLLHGKMMVYADDGSPVNTVEDIIAFFEPGPFREAAFAVYAQMVTGSQEAKLAPPVVKDRTPAPRKAAVKTTAKPAGRKVPGKKSDSPKAAEAAAG